MACCQPGDGLDGEMMFGIIAQLKEAMDGTGKDQGVQSPSVLVATIDPSLDLDGEQENAVIEELDKAMTGAGTNEAKIIELLVSFNNYQRRKIALAYQAAMGKPLDEALREELSGDFEQVILAMLKSPRELDAIMLRDAMTGIGTDEKMLITILTTRTNDEISEIKEEYKKLCDSELEDDLASETSGYFKRMMRSMCTGFRQVEECDNDYAREQAQKLIDAGVAQCGTDECDFNQVLCLNSLPSLRKILDAYRELAGTELEDAISAEFSGDIAEGYRAIIQVARNVVDFFAERLYNATIGKIFGTNDDEVIRIIVARSEIDLKDICEVFEAKYGQTLYDTIVSETSGDYQHTLLCLIKGGYFSKE